MGVGAEQVILGIHFAPRGGINDRNAHRQAAFEACEFLVDWLKTKAPFWKLEETPTGEKWVGAHEGDDAAAARWEKKSQ